MKIDNIDLRLLRVFHMLAERGGFAGAQAELGVAASTISIHLSHLEQRLGVVLCRRGRGGFALTEEGQRVHDATKRLFAAMETFRVETTSLRGRLIGELAIGIVDNTVTDPGCPLADAIRRFMQRENDVHLHIVVNTPSGLNHALREGQIHAAIAVFPNRLPGLEYQTLYREAIRLYCGRGNPLFNLPESTIDEARVLAQPFASRIYNADRDLAAVGPVNHRASVENIEALVHLIRSGCFTGFLPEHLARIWVERGEMRALRPDRYQLEADFQLALPGRPGRNRLLECFLADVREAVAQRGGPPVGEPAPSPCSPRRRQSATTDLR
jgi:DNA-binding transcriptional LysR family regulator